MNRMKKADADFIRTITKLDALGSKYSDPMAVTPPIDQLIRQALDVYGGQMQVEVDPGRSIVYVHVNGVTILRANPATLSVEVVK